MLSIVQLLFYSQASGISLLHHHHQIYHHRQCPNHYFQLGGLQPDPNMSFHLFFHLVDGAEGEMGVRRCLEYKI